MINISEMHKIILTKNDHITATPSGSRLHEDLLSF